MKRKSGTSIRSRIFFYFLMFTVLLLALLWVLQTVLLDDFYRHQKMSTLTSAADSIADNIGNVDVLTLVKRISEENDICVLIVSENGIPMISAESASVCAIHSMSSRDMRMFIERLNANDGVVFHVFSMISFRNHQYDASRYTGRVPKPDNGDAQSMLAAQRVELESGRSVYVFLNTMITPVSAIVETLRLQLVFASVVLVFLSFFISLVLSRRITQPIVLTTAAAKELSVGRFTSPITSITYSEVELLNRQLEQAAQDLVRVEAVQRELIANISHDLRTPLTLIEGYAEVIRDFPGENTGENMQIIIDETKRLSTLVNAILEYSVGKSGRNKTQATVFDLTESVLEILKRYQKLTEQDGYIIHFEYEQHVQVLADKMKVGQVVYNLINNALTYTGEDKTVIVRQKTEGDHVKMEVQDTGEGIAPGEIDLVWSRYYRSSKPHKRPAIGTGLGLNIVQGILEEHHLQYGVDSRENEGTIFWFCLPIESEQ